MGLFRAPAQDVGEAIVVNVAYEAEPICVRQIQKLEELKNEKKKIRESLQSKLENDAEYSVALDVFTVASKEKTKRKFAVMRTAEALQLKFKEKEVREQIKEIEESLSNNLEAFCKQSGQLALQVDGELIPIVRKYKVKKQ